MCAYRKTVTAGSSNESLDLIIGSGDYNANNKFFPDRPMDLLGVYAQGATLTNCSILTPRLSEIAPFQVRPFVVGSAVPTNPNFCHTLPGPIALRRQETIDVRTSNSAGAGEVHIALVFLGLGGYGRRAGNSFRIRGTATTTAVANTWTLLTITWDANLAEGTYEIRGFEHISANSYAARLNVPGSPWKPGVTGLASVGSRLPAALLDGQFGSLGTFSTIAYPQVEVLCSAGDTAHTIFMDLIKIG